MSNQRKQMMQPWPLCLAPFAKTKEQAILPRYYARVSPSKSKGSGSKKSEIGVDCCSSTTISTSASPFNSQTALITKKEKKKSRSNYYPEDSTKITTITITAPDSTLNDAYEDYDDDKNDALLANITTENHYYDENLRNNQPRAHIYDPRKKHLDVDYNQLDSLLKSVELNRCTSNTRTLMDSQMDVIKPPKEGLEMPPIQSQKPKNQSLFSSQYLTQILAALSVSMGSMVVGYASAYTSPALVSMENNATTPFLVDKDTAMWIGSIMPLSAFFGGIAGGPSIEYLGRRNTILGIALPFIGAWLLITLATNVPMVLTGRALCGFCVGVASLSLPVYLGETIQTEVRGKLGLLPTAFGNTGILLCFIVGKYLNWRNLALVGSVLPVPFLLMMFMIPETPRWYISKSKTKKARKSLQWLRGKRADITEELTGIEKIHIESERNASQGAFSELFKSNHLKPTLISFGLMFFQQMSGINAIIFYTVQIFKDAGSSIDENLSAIIIGIVNFISTFVATTVIDRLGRKLLLYISAVGMGLTLTTLGTFFYLQYLMVDVSAFGWIPLLSLIVYVVAFSLGLGPIPWLMMGEILPAKIRGSAASVVTSSNWAFTFIVTKTYQDIIKLIGAHGTFWMFGCICFAGFVFVIFCVPETRGRSLEEIEKRFTGPVRRMSAVANMKPMPMAC